MIEDMHKIIHIKDVRHRMPYVYFLNKVFSYFIVVLEKSMPGTVKKMFILNTLIENEYMEGKVGTKSYIFELIDVQENLDEDMEVLRLALATKDTDISHFKVRVQ